MALAEHFSTLGDQLRQTRGEASVVRDELSSIGAELQELLRMEADLAKAETSEAAAHATRSASFGVVGAVLGLITAIFLFLTIMFALDEALPLWASALITAIIALVLTGIFMLLARTEMKKFSPTPRRFMRSMQEDLQWARDQLRLNMR